MPSLSSLEGEVGAGGGGGGERQQKKGRSAEVGAMCKDAGQFWGRKQSTIPQDFLAGSDTEHTLLTKQSKTNAFQCKSQKTKYRGSSYTCAWLETFAHFHPRLLNEGLRDRQQHLEHVCTSIELYSAHEGHLSSHLGAWLRRAWGLYLGNFWDLNSSIEDIPGQLSSVGVPVVEQPFGPVS